MTPEELNKAIEQLKAEGHSEEEILGGFYKMFQNDQLTLDELDGIVNAMGYHLTDEFKNMSPEDQKTKGYEETEEPAEGVDKEDVNDAKETDESDESENKNEDDKSENESDDNDKSESEEDESEEEKRAMKLFGN